MRTLSRWCLTVLYTDVALVCLHLSQANLVWVFKPENRAIAIGEDLVLPCLAKLTTDNGPLPTLSYTWQLNGGNLTSKASRFSNNSLFISTVSSAELGNYSCIVTYVDQTDTNHSSISAESLTGTANVIEAYILPFVIHPESLEAAVGEEVILTCVTGRSAPGVQVWWLRDGEVFTQGDTQVAAFGDYDTTGLSVQLSVKLMFKISLETLGSFECVAFNDVLSVGAQSQQANVTKKVIPSDNLPVIEWNLPASLVVAEGQPLILPCDMKDSTEPATVYWYLGQYRVDESKQLYILPNNSLRFSQVGPKDNGNYSCSAQNSKGTSKSPKIQLIVAFLGYSFRTNPSSAYAVYGQNVTLECDPPDSTPAATVIWYKDYSPIDLLSSRVKVIKDYLHLEAVMKVDNGIYYCVAFNNLTVPTSRTSKVARLTVEGPPLMIEPPMNVKVIRGKLLHLTCLVDSDPVPNTVWQFEGMALLQGGQVSLVNRGQELFITDVGKEWEGRFTCLSRNKFGHTSAEASVIILVPPVSLQAIGDLTVKSGDSLLIPCPIVGSPVPVIHWFFNGVAVSINGSVASIPEIDWTFRSPDLYISNILQQHAGKYSCFGSNDAGNTSSSGTVTVLSPPIITNVLENTTAVIGASVTLTCAADGSPVPSVKWLYNSTEQLPENVQLMDANKTLVISVLSWNSVGVYTCMAQSVTGSVNASSAVGLFISPEIDEIQFPTSPVKIYTNFSLSCTASGIPMPSVTWAHLGKPVLASQDGRVQIPEMGVLIVKLAVRNDSGEYECWVESKLGKQRKMVSIVVYGPPSPPELLSVVPASSSSVYLFWKWSDHEDISERVETFQVYFREKVHGVTNVYSRLPLKNETRIEVSGLQPATEYVFYISSVNDAGIGPPSNILSAVTQQFKPSAPRNFHASSLASTSVTLTWEMPVLPNGLVRAYQLRYKRISNIEQDYTYVNITKPQFPSNDIILSPLLPYSGYLADVCACNINNGQNMCGDYSSITFHTLASKPSSPPQFVNIDVLDPYSLRVTWQHIPVLAQNGPLLYYIIFISNESQSVSSTRVNSTETSYAVRGLFPWRFYSVTLAGQNIAGIGPTSASVGARTLPIAPVAPPGSFYAFTNDSSCIQLYWKALPANMITCNITAYIVEFRQQGSSAWNSTSVASTSSKTSYSYIIQSLLPWTWYECQITAFSNTLTPGAGPFTDSILIRTLQGVSSPVTYLTYTSNSTQIFLSWQPPRNVKGILIGYRVIYENVGNESMKQSMDVSSEHTTAALNDLASDTLYNISVAAVNSAGGGMEQVLMVRTLSAPPASFMSPITNITISSTSSTNTTQHSLRQSDSNHITKNLASIVAGSIVGAIALIIVAVFICMKCMKYKQKQRLHYVIGDDSVGVEATSYRSLEPSSGIVTISSSKSYEVINSQSSATAIQSSNTTQSALHEDFRTGESSTKSKKVSNVKEEKHRKHSRISVPILSITSSYTTLQEDNAYLDVNSNEEMNGIDNPVFIAINIEPAADVQPEVNPRPLHDDHHLSVVNDDTMSVSSSDSMRRRNRMHSENAAAIAVLRSTRLGLPDNTDTFTDYDSISTEVIFNERTVL